MADARERSKERREAQGYDTDHKGDEETMFCPMCNHTTTDVDHALRAELRLSKPSVTRGNVTKPKFYKVQSTSFVSANVLHGNCVEILFFLNKHKSVQIHTHVS